MTLEPITRKEQYLAGIIDGIDVPDPAITRIEMYLAAIKKNETCALEPVTRVEMYLAKISGQDVALPEPVTRIEMYLAAIAGEDVELPENPITRLEMYLAEWADSGDWTTISGAIVEFITQRAHKLKSCVVTLEPQQDLHGYDSPWPEGGSKNLLKLTVESAKSLNNSGVWNGNSYTKTGITFTLITDESGVNVLGVKVNGTSTAITDFILASYDLPTVETAVAYVLSGCPSGGGITSYYLDFRNDNNVQIRDTGDKAAIYSTGQTGRYSQIIIAANYTASNLIFYPMIRLSTEAVDYAPYSNICPISGWTGCEVYVTGHNVWDEEWINGYIGAQGQYVYNANYIVSKNYIPVAPSTTYFLQTNGAQWEVYSYRADKSFIKRLVIYGADLTFTTEDDCRYIHIVSHNETQTYGHDVSVNYPSTDHDYHAYNGYKVSITWQSATGTVYGGTVTINQDGSVELSAEYAIDTYDGSETWTKSSTAAQGFWHTNNNVKRLLDYTGEIICDTLPTFKGYNDTDYRNAENGITAYNSSGYDGQNWIYAKADGIETVADFQTWLESNNLIVVYPLATPLTYQLSPTEVTALLGVNNVWADTGDVTVTFRGTPIEEPDAEPLQALNLLLGGAYRNEQTPEDVPDDEALDILLGGADR